MYEKKYIVGTYEACTFPNPFATFGLGWRWEEFFMWNDQICFAVAKLHKTPDISYLPITPPTKN